jgi:hypothetical protein
MCHIILVWISLDAYQLSRVLIIKKYVINIVRFML